MRPIGESEFVRACEGSVPNLLFAGQCQRSSIDRSEHLIEVPQARSRGNPFNRDSAELTTKFHKDAVLCPVNRRKIHVPCFGFDDLVPIGIARQNGDAQPSPRSDDANDAVRGERTSRPA